MTGDLCFSPRPDAIVNTQHCPLVPHLSASTFTSSPVTVAAIVPASPAVLPSGSPRSIRTSRPSIHVCPSSFNPPSYPISRAQRPPPNPNARRYRTTAQYGQHPQGRRADDGRRQQQQQSRPRPGPGQRQQPAIRPSVKQPGRQPAAEQRQQRRRRRLHERHGAEHGRCVHQQW